MCHCMRFVAVLCLPSPRLGQCIWQSYCRPLVSLPLLHQVHILHRLLICVAASPVDRRPKQLPSNISFIKGKSINTELFNFKSPSWPKTLPVWPAGTVKTQCAGITQQVRHHLWRTWMGDVSGQNPSIERNGGGAHRRGRRGPSSQ